MAAGTVIYGISGDAVFRIRNTHGDSTSRPAAEAVIYGIFGDAAFEIGNTHEEVMSRIAKVTCFTVKLAVPAGPPPKTATLPRIGPSIGRWGP